MSVYEVGSGKWKINITLGGQRINRIAGKTKKEARQVEAELKTKFRLKQLHISDIQGKEIPLFMELAKQYLKHIEDTSSHRTWELYFTDYKNHLDPVFGGIPVDSDHLSNKNITDYQAQKKKEGYANRTVNIHIGIISKIINFGKGNGYIDKGFTLKYPMLTEHRKELAFLDFDEWERLKQNVHLRIVLARIEFGRLTGLRPAELQYLDWDDISWEMKTVRVQRKPGIWDVKGYKERTIPLSDDAVTLLREVQAYKKRMKHKSRWIFSNSTKPVKKINKSLINAGKKAGIKKRVTPNMVRHTFATHALAKGADLKSVMDIMGHSNLSTTQRYLHGMQDRLRSAVDSLNSPQSSFPSPYRKKQSIRRGKGKKNAKRNDLRQSRAKGDFLRKFTENRKAHKH